jgi:hypothetical protein
MATNSNSNSNRAKTNANVAQDPAAELLAAALQAMAVASLKPTKRATAQSRSEDLAQPLTDRDRAALTRAGWVKQNGDFQRLSSPSPQQPKPTAKIKAGPSVNVARFADLTPERQASAQFWAGLCSILARSSGRIWLPEVAAVAAQLGVTIDGPAQLAARLTALVGLPVSRPKDQAGWLICNIEDPMPGSEPWAQLWNTHLQAFTDKVAAGD